MSLAHEVSKLREKITAQLASNPTGPNASKLQQGLVRLDALAVKCQSTFGKSSTEMANHVALNSMVTNLNRLVA